MRKCRVNHAAWLANESIIWGHSSSCPENEAQSIRQSVANALANYIENKLNVAGVLDGLPFARSFMNGILARIRDGRWAT